MQPRSSFGLLVLAFALAGCLSPAGKGPATTEPSDVATPNWPELGALVFSDSHDHRDRTIHTEVQAGLRLLSDSTLSENGKSLGEYTEVDHQRGLIAAAVVTGPGSTMEIVLFDEAALPEIKVVSRFVEPSSYGDVKLDRSQPLVYVPYAENKGFSIWDISDLEAPRRVGEAQGPGCHMLNTLLIADTTYVFCAALGGSYIYRIQPTALGLEGVVVAVVTPQSDPEAARYATYYQRISPLGPALVTTPHDQTAQIDPITKAPILVTAHELQGIRVYDVSIPSAPREISHWRGNGAPHPIERIHTVGLAQVNGKRLGIGVTETFTNVPPVLYIVDFTDYAAPRFLAEWVPPGIKDDQGITFSLHNFQVVGTRLYVTNFHAGLWVLNITDASHPEIEALRTPVRDTEYPYPGQAILPGVYNDVNQFWDVIVVNGYTIVTDMSAGIEVLSVDGDEPGDQDLNGFT